MNTHCTTGFVTPLLWSHMSPYLYYGVICLHSFCNNFIAHLNFFVTHLFVTCSWGQEGVHKNIPEVVEGSFWKLVYNGRTILKNHHDYFHDLHEVVGLHLIRSQYKKFRISIHRSRCEGSTWIDAMTVNLSDYTSESTSSALSLVLMCVKKVSKSFRKWICNVKFKNEFL